MHNPTKSKAPLKHLIKALTRNEAATEIINKLKIRLSCIGCNHQSDRNECIIWSINAWLWDPLSIGLISHVIKTDQRHKEFVMRLCSLKEMF